MGLTLTWFPCSSHRRWFLRSSRLCAGAINRWLHEAGGGGARCRSARCDRESESSRKHGRARLRRRGISILVFVLLLGQAFAHADTAEAKLVGRRVVSGVEQSVAFTVSTGGRIWVVEKARGNILVFNTKSGGHHLFFHVPGVSAQVEQGLVGIALHPGFPRVPWVYVFATRSVGGRLLDQVLSDPFRPRAWTGHARHVLGTSELAS